MHAAMPQVQLVNRAERVYFFPKLIGDFSSFFSSLKLPQFPTQIIFGLQLATKLKPYAR